ncbi:MAG TPA: histidine kinase [Solirubrobacteraceae bacterium]|nr:histidine kinase [Solirubrobacteraceae bacterium]
MISLARRIWRSYACYGIWSAPGDPVPPEVLFLRLLGLGYFALIIIGTTTTSPQPALAGRGLPVLLALICLVVAILVSNPRSSVRPWTRVEALTMITVAAAVLAAAQPNGLWEATPYYVAIVAAMRLDRKVALWVLGLNLVVLGSIAGVTNHWGQAVGTLIGAVPWFLVMGQMRRMREQNVALEASQAAEARAAAAAERGRLAREMHDVLAHTLSALALQLESTRLLAHDRGVDADVSRAIGQAHGLAASGLEEARRAISAARGDALPGPERVQSLAEAVTEQSGLPVTVDVRGEPRELPADARLAVYRTAQEALTNVRRHATPDRVEVQLDYRPDAVALVVEDHGARSAVGVGGGALGDSGAGYGLTGMRERAELLGGTLVAEPTADGFRVQLVLPA